MHKQFFYSLLFSLSNKEQVKLLMFATCTDIQLISHSIDGMRASLNAKLTLNQREEKKPAKQEV
jgi:hypothetical protein